MDNGIAIQPTLSPVKPKPFRIALAGNPNAGKTTIFNALTGDRQHVGNYPGVTVEKKEGMAEFAGASFTVVDLPGTYSLSAGSLEEIVTRDFLLAEQPDVVVDIVDASNLERHLYLAVQLMELGVPLVLALNMSDVARAKGFRINHTKLAKLLGVPVVPTEGHTGRGIPELLQAVAKVCQKLDSQSLSTRQVDYGHEVEPHVEQLTAAIRRRGAGSEHARWHALQLLAGDGLTGHDDDVNREAARLRAHIERISGADIGMVLTDARYGFIAGACTEAVSQVETAETRLSRSERIDRVVLNRWLGLPIFAGLMYVLFYLTFALAAPLTKGLEAVFGQIGGFVSSWWPAGSHSLLKSLLVDGIGGGVGGVLVFLPNILLLFLAIALLEDTGYMARAVFITDRWMHKIGLHGKSFIPMLIGFGCTVPAIMATRTLETRRDRLTTILVLPLMSCGARLLIYALFIPAFFPPAWQAPVLWLLYIIGILLAVGLAKLLRVTLFAGEPVPFVMELPPYRLPTWRGLLQHMGERGWLFVRKAGTIILGFAIVLWALSVWPRADRPEQQLEHSAIGHIGKGIAPLFKPLGFDWKVSTSLLSALAAKELFVAQMGIVHSVDATQNASATLRAKLQAAYTPLQGFCIMLFCLIGMPCLATVAVTKQETGSWNWVALQWGGLTVLAWTVTTLVYQIGNLFSGRNI